MTTKRQFFLLAFQFPIAFIVGALIYFVYSLQVHETVHVDWLVALGLAVVIDLIVLIVQKRDEQHRLRAGGHPPTTPK